MILRTLIYLLSTLGCGSSLLGLILIILALIILFAGSFIG